MTETAIARAARADSPPTEARPETGVLMLFDVEIAHALYWVEDDQHVIRSTEFDVIAGAPTFEEALSKFGDNVMAFGLYLAELDDVAENEKEMLAILAPRIVEAMRQARRVEMRRPRSLLGVTVTLSRRRGDDASQWHPQSRPHSSSQPSLA